MIHSAALVFLCFLSVSRSEVALRHLSMQRDALMELERLEARYRLVSDSIRITAREREDLMKTLSRYTRRLAAAERHHEKRTASLRRLVDRSLEVSGDLEEGTASPAPVLFGRLEELDTERHLLAQSMRSIRRDIAQVKQLHASLGKILSHLRQSRDAIKTRLVRKREEIWRLSQQTEGYRALFDTRHFDVLSQIRSIRTRLKMLDTPVELRLPVKGAWLVARAGSGMLLSVKPGSLVRAPASGTVLYAGRYPGRGQGIVMSHSNGQISVILDLAEVMVRSGQHVEGRVPVGFAPLASGSGKNARVTIYYGKNKSI